VDGLSLPSLTTAAKEVLEVHFGEDEITRAPYLTVVETRRQARWNDHGFPSRKLGSSSRGCNVHVLGVSHKWEICH